MSLLELRRVTAGYRNNPAIHDIDLTVEPGEIVTLLGPNGTGKSTLLATVMGQIRPMAGEVRLDGAVLGRTRTHRRVRNGIALVPEGRGIVAGLTVEENVRVVKNGELAVLDLFPELDPLRSRPVELLSGGEQQMVAMARALATQPRLLLVDELSLGLAPVIVQRLFRSLEEAARERDVAVLLVEQHVRQALQVATRAYVMSLGRIVSISPAADLLADTQVIEASYLGRTS